MIYFKCDSTNIIIGLVISLTVTAIAVNEFFPKFRMSYSKFANIKTSGKTITSRYGMLLIYSPALAASSFLLYKNFGNDAWHLKKANQMLMLSIIILLHYIKRVLEVLFMHQYSGYCRLYDSLIISSGYVSYAIILNIFTEQVPVSRISSSSITLGFILFVVGECINFYHHVILRNLRKDGSKEYKIPNEGFFVYIWCPHYLGEIISFISMALVSQHLFALLAQMGSIAYLVVRAYNTREWYKKKFDVVPERRCLVPFIF